MASAVARIGFLLCCLAVMVHGNENWSHVVAVPKKIVQGSPVTVTLNLARPLPAGTQLTFTLVDHSDRVVSQVDQSYSSTATAYEVLFSAAPAYYYFKVESSNSGPDAISSAKAYVEVISRSNSIYVLTDKPIYKPSQTVHFRVIQVDKDLKPQDSELSVTIQTAEGNKIRQWIQNTSLGVATFELPLADRPPLGTWKIIVRTGDQEVTQDIEIDEYVLPRFEVTLDLPKYWLTSSSFSGTVSSTYTYGEDVEGDVTLRASIKNCRMCLPLEKTLKLNGATSFTLTSADLDLLKGEMRSLDGFDLQIVAVATEKLTGEKQNTTSGAPITMYPARLEFTDFTPSNYKRGAQLTVYLSLTKPDGAPVDLADLDQQVTIMERSSQTSLGSWSVSAEGNVMATFQPPEGMSGLQLEASITVFNTDLTDDKYITSADIRGNNSVTLQLDNSEDIMSGSTVNFTVTVGQPSSTTVVHWMAVARNRIVASGTHSLSDGNTISVHTTPAFAPQTTVVVSAAGTDGELVADSLTFVVYGAFENRVGVEFAADNGAGGVMNVTERMPGQSVRVDVTSEPGSFVGLLSVDKSVLLLGKNNFTQDLILRDVAGEDGSSGGREDGIIWCFFPRWGASNARDVFEEAGLHLLTDAFVQHSWEIMRRNKGGAVEFAMAVPEAGLMPLANTPGLGTEQTTAVRKNFPETWLWHYLPVDDVTGRMSFPTRVPDTITSWVTTAFTMHPVLGLAVTPQPTTIRVFKEFFISLSLPYSVKRGEVMEVKVLVFNYQSAAASVSIQVAASPMFKLGLTATALALDPLTLSVPSIAAGGSAVALFYLQPLVISKTAPLTVEAEASTGLRDALIRTLLVKAEGVEQRFCYKRFVKGDEVPATGSLDVAFPLRYPSNVVAGSHYIEYQLSGDVMSSSIKNLDNLVTTPYGCGEQNMISFVPNIYVKKYLRTTAQPDDEIERDTTRNMIQGYQRELTYMRTSGSFSAFGNRDDRGSTWLTAFVVRSFRQAAEEISGVVDEEIVLRAGDWLLSKVDNNGAFVEHGRVIHTEMQGGSSNGVALNAFVIIGLLEGAGSLPFAQGQAIGRAVAILESLVLTLDDPYLLSISTYALLLNEDRMSSPPANSPGVTALARLSEMATRSDGEMYWTKAQPSTVDASCEQRGYCYRRPRSSDVEMTAYAMLSYVLKDDLVSAGAIAKWITRQQTPNGGFSSTQDTTLALQALSVYAEATFDPSGSLSAEFTADSGQTHTLTVGADTASLLQSFVVPEPGDVSQVNVKLTGQKSAIVGVCGWFNVDEVSPVDAEVEVTVTVIKISESQYTLRTCGRALNGVETGMAVMRVGLPSGYAARPTQVHDNLKMAEVSGEESVLYLNELGAPYTCEDVMIDRQQVVMDPKPAFVSVYPYYKEEAGVVAKYTLANSTIVEPVGGTATRSQTSALAVTALLLLGGCLIRLF